MGKKNITLNYRRETRGLTDFIRILIFGTATVGARGVEVLVAGEDHLRRRLLPERFEDDGRLFGGFRR